MAGNGQGLTRRTTLAAGAACLLAGLTGAVSGRAEAVSPYELGRPTLTTRARRAAQPDAVFAVRTHRRELALTFDDGPDPDYTPYVLDLLDRYEARATFFVVGVNAVVWPDLLHEVVRRGHSLGNHTHQHADLYALQAPAVGAEIAGCSADLAAAGMRRPTWFRPPKGFTSPTVALVARRQRLRTAFWSHCLEACHPVGTPRDQAVRQLVDRLLPGQVLLAHDGGRVMAPGGQVIDRGATMEALPVLLERLRRDRWDVVDLPTLGRQGSRH
jgi:peptidoglycan-N-acetylglucosamine deacetylase